jgi:hypothetical protein
MARKAKRPKSPLAQVQAVAEARWRPVLGDPDSRVPTTLEAVVAMEEALAAVVDEAEADHDLAVALGDYARTCVWSRRDSFVGTWAAPIGGVGMVIAMLVLGRGGASDWLAASMVWAAGVPLYLQAATARQYDINADVISEHRTLDDRYLGFVAAGPPLLTPLWLALRAVAYGIGLPAAVVHQALRRKRYLPILALVGISVGALVFATFEPGGEGIVQVEGADPTAAPLASPAHAFVPVVLLRGVEHPILPGSTVTLTLTGGVPDTSRLGEPTTVDDRSAGGCTTILRTWDGPPKVRERSSRCAGQAETIYEYVLR